jgi:hypothetical protein
MKMYGSNILITLILPVYLNILATSAVRFNTERFVQENPTICNYEFSMDDRTSDFYYYDAVISESFITGVSNTIFHDEYPLIISGNYEPILLWIDLPPPVYKG